MSVSEHCLVKYRSSKLGFTFVYIKRYIFFNIYDKCKFETLVAKTPESFGYSEYNGVIVEFWPF